MGFEGNLPNFPNMCFFHILQKWSWGIRTSLHLLVCLYHVSAVPSNLSCPKLCKKGLGPLGCLFHFWTIRCLVILMSFFQWILMSSHGMSQICRHPNSAMSCRARYAWPCSLMVALALRALAAKLARKARPLRENGCGVVWNVNGEPGESWNLSLHFGRHPLPLYRVCYVNHRLIVCVSWCVTLNEMSIEHVFPLPEQLQAAKVEKCQWSSRPPLSHPGWSSQFTLLPSRG